jgi:hypothetical protein
LGRRPIVQAHEGAVTELSGRRLRSRGMRSAQYSIRATQSDLLEIINHGGNCVTDEQLIVNHWLQCACLKIGPEHRETALGKGHTSEGADAATPRFC